MAITTVLLVAACGAAFRLRPPRRTTALLAAAAHAAVVPGALLTMLALLVPTVGWLCTAMVSGLATSLALWVLRASSPPPDGEPGDGDGGWGGGGAEPIDDGDGPTAGLPIDWAAFERDALAAWRAYRDRQTISV